MTKTHERLPRTQPLDHGKSNTAKDLLREGGKIAEHPDEIQPLPEGEPQISGPNWGQDFHNTTAQLVGHAQPAYTGGLPDHWQFGQRLQDIMALALRQCKR